MQFIENAIILSAFVVSPFTMIWFFKQLLDAEKAPVVFNSLIATTISALMFITMITIVAKHLF
jgi:hypothetical protein